MNKYGIYLEDAMSQHVKDSIVEAIIDAYLEQYLPDTQVGVPDPYAHLKQAAADPTKQIRCRHSLGFNAGSGNWNWCEPPEAYEIRDKPKTMKKVKLWAWLSGTNLFWRTANEDDYGVEGWKRVPSEDKEVEIEE